MFSGEKNELFEATLYVEGTRCRSTTSRRVTRHHFLMAYVHNMSVMKIRQGHNLWITQTDTNAHAKRCKTTAK